MAELLASVPTLRDRPSTPDKSTQKQSSSAKWARMEEQSAMFFANMSRCTLLKLMSWHL